LFTVCRQGAFLIFGANFGAKIKTKKQGSGEK